MTYEMNLNPIPFNLIRDGHKSIEMRLCKGGRRLIHIGDEIRFTNTEDKTTLIVRVKHIYIFKDFKELYDYFTDKTILGYQKDEVASPDDMLIYYSLSDIKTYGVVGFEISL